MAKTIAASDVPVGGALIALPWESADGQVPSTVALRLVRACTERMLPGAHMVLLVPSNLVDQGGLAVRMAGCEVRDGISSIIDGRVWVWLLARKDIPSGVVLDSVLEHGTGAVNIDACRLETQGRPLRVLDPKPTNNVAIAGQVDEAETYTDGSRAVGVTDEGRYPPNVMLDDAAAARLDKTHPDAGAGGPASGPTQSGPFKSNSMQGAFRGMGDTPAKFHGDSGGASRFFPRANDVAEAQEWLLRLITVPDHPTLVITDTDGVVLHRAPEVAAEAEAAS